ncbi:MAG: hypothetical protein GKC04_07065 [Methanomicrobiales archaeon]|nr:hypothetical protein [Methanomicrobiales archaeon]
MIIGQEWIIILFGVVIVFLLYIVYMSLATIAALLERVDRLSGQVDTTQSLQVRLARDLSQISGGAPLSHSDLKELARIAEEYNSGQQPSR